MEVYLDNAATTRCDNEVAALINEILVNDYGNPSSMHALGVKAERRIKTSLEQIAKTLKCKPNEILFTSGGTESDNLALLGVAHAYARTGNHIITTAIEHPAVAEAAAQLEKEGFRVTYLPVDKEGIVSLSALEEALCDDTILVSVMQVNNELGSVQPIEEIGRIIKARRSDIFFHVDGIQGYGKVPLSLSRAQVDLYSVSAHKIHGPKGAGFLYVKKGVRLLPLLHGGGQQNDLRSGTENVAGCAGTGLAAEKVFSTMEEDAARMRALRSLFCEGVLQEMEDVVVNGAGAESASPHIVSLTVRDVRAEVLLHALEDKGIYVSAGSACATNHPKVSPVLKAAGLSDEDASSTIRFSLSRETTKEEIVTTLDALKDVVPTLRKFQRM